MSVTTQRSGGERIARPARRFRTRCVDPPFLAASDADLEQGGNGGHKSRAAIGRCFMSPSRSLQAAAAWPQQATPAPADAPGMTNDSDGLYWLLNEDDPAASQATTPAWEALARLGLDTDLIDDAIAIVGELAANAIVAGFPPVELQLQPSSREVKLLVVDRGLSRPTWGPAGLESLGGRGLLGGAADSGGNCGTATAAYRSIANLGGKAVWAVIPRRPGRLDDLQPAAAARLLQRWLARRGLRDVLSRSGGRVSLASVAAGCTLRGRPGRPARRTEGAAPALAPQQSADTVAAVA